MKKLILAVLTVIMLAPAFTSCDKGKYKCYEVTMSTPDGTTMTIHKWMRETDKDAYVKEREARGYYIDEIVEADASRQTTMADCNPPEEI